MSCRPYGRPRTRPVIAAPARPSTHLVDERPGRTPAPRRRPAGDRPAVRRPGRRHARLVPRRRPDHVGVRGHRRARGPRARHLAVRRVADASRVLLYLSVLVHELSHTVVALALRAAGPPDQPAPARRRLGDRASRPRRPGREARIAVAGPLVSLLLAAVALRRRRAARADGTVRPLLAWRADARATCSSGPSTCCPACRWTAAGCCRQRSGGPPATATPARWSPRWAGRAVAVVLLGLPFLRRGPARRRRLDGRPHLGGPAGRRSSGWARASRSCRRNVQQRLPGRVGAVPDPARGPGGGRRAARGGAAPRPRWRGRRAGRGRRRRHAGRAGQRGAPCATSRSSAGRGSRSATWPTPGQPDLDAAGRPRPARSWSRRITRPAGHASTSWSRPTVTSTGCSPLPTSSAALTRA